MNTIRSGAQVEMDVQSMFEEGCGFDHSEYSTSRRATPLYVDSLTEEGRAESLSFIDLAGELIIQHPPTLLLRCSPSPAA